MPEAAADAVTNLLTEEVGGVELRDSETLAATEEGLAELLCWVPGSLVDARVERVELLMKSLGEMGVPVDSWSWKSEEVEPRQWHEAYKEHFGVTHLGRFIVIKPSWLEYEPSPTDRVVELDPGMAFGTGLHASTGVMVGAMERLAARSVPPKKVLDMGAGTGILSLAAARLWPNSKIKAIDLDEIAVEVCRENVERNGASRQVKAEQLSGAEVNGQYNLVLANLNRELLTELQPRMRSLLADGGYLIISGFLSEYTKELSLVYSRDLQLEPECSLAQDGWTALKFRARP